MKYTYYLFLMMLIVSCSEQSVSTTDQQDNVNSYLKFLSEKGLNTSNYAVENDKLILDGHLVFRLGEIEKSMNKKRLKQFRYFYKLKTDIVKDIKIHIDSSDPSFKEAVLKAVELFSNVKGSDVTFNISSQQNAKLVFKETKHPSKSYFPTSSGTLGSSVIELSIIDLAKLKPAQKTIYVAHYIGDALGFLHHPASLPAYLLAQLYIPGTPINDPNSYMHLPIPQHIDNFSKFDELALQTLYPKTTPPDTLNLQAIESLDFVNLSISQNNVVTAIGRDQKAYIFDIKKDTWNQFPNSPSGFRSIQSNGTVTYTLDNNNFLNVFDGVQWTKRSEKFGQISLAEDGTLVASGTIINSGKIFYVSYIFENNQFYIMNYNVKSVFTSRSDQIYVILRDDKIYMRDPNSSVFTNNFSQLQLPKNQFIYDLISLSRTGEFFFVANDLGLATVDERIKERIYKGTSLIEQPQQNSKGFQKTIHQIFPLNNGKLIYTIKESSKPITVHKI